MTNEMKHVAIYSAFSGDSTPTAEEIYEYYKLGNTTVALVNMIEDSDYGTAFFADTTITSLSDKLEILYNQVLGRESDAEGKEYWLGRLEDGTATLTSIASDFLDGAVASGEFVEADYTQLAGELASYVPVDEPVVVEGQTFDLKLGETDVTGTDGNDTFIADQAQSSWTGGVANTLSSASDLDGGAGTDTLHAEIVGEFVGVEGAGAQDTDIQPETNSIEIVTIENKQDNSIVTIDAKEMFGVTTIGSFYSDGDLVIENLTTLNSNIDGRNEGELGARNTNTMTITMDHTDNFNSDGDASDLTVLFDEDYFLTNSTTSGASLTINMINTLNNELEDGAKSLIEGFETVSFSVGDTEITVDISGAELSEVKGLIEDALDDAGITTVTVDTYLEPAFFATNIYYEDTDTTYKAGTSAGPDYTAFVLTNSGAETLSEGGFTLADGARDGSLAYSQDDRDPQTAQNPLSVDVELFKVGREGEGGDLVIGGKELNYDDYEGQIIDGVLCNADGDPIFDPSTNKGDGIEEFRIDVKGTASQASNLGTITSTNAALDRVYIETHADYKGNALQA
jgi:hypothetical protein